MGISADESSRAQRLAKIPEQKVQDYIDEQKAGGGEISRIGLIRFATGTEKAGLAAHVSANSGVPEWYTPEAYLDAARATLGQIDLDPASSMKAQKRVKAKRFYTLDSDGLAHEWKGNVWLNPPYTSGLVDRFVAKLCEHYSTGDVPAALLLVNNATETKWFQHAALHATGLCLPAGRIRFLDENGNPGAPTQGQALLYFGRTSTRFFRVFSPIGVCAAIVRDRE